MINRGLAWKAVRETWTTTAVVAVMVFCFDAALAYALPTYFEPISQSISQIAIARNFVEGLLGASIPGDFGPDAFLAFPWIHPVVLSLVWAHAVMHCTRVPAGEIEQGSIDVLLGWPVGRWEVLCVETLVGVAGGGVVLASLVAGNWTGGSGVAESMRPDTARTLIVAANLFALYVAVSGLAWFVSACSDRRSAAIGVLFFTLLASFLLHVLSPFWAPARRVDFLSFLTYYRPLAALQEGVFPTWDVAVLLGCGAAFWLVAGVVFARRDVCTL